MKRCPICGSEKLLLYGDDPAGVLRCGDCGHGCLGVEAQRAGVESQILEELKKINERLNALGRKAPNVDCDTGGCPNCGCKDFLGEFTPDGKFLLCRFCGHEFYGRLG